MVLDANPGPGGAWWHRWPSLTFGGAHGIHDLPGLPLGVPDPAEPASAVVARYYGEYERRFGLPVHRPVAVRRVEAESADRPLEVVTDAGTWRTELVVNGTGTWDRPYWPYCPGRESFRGRQLHTHDFRSAEEFRGRLADGREVRADTILWTTEMTPVPHEHGDPRNEESDQQV